MIGQTLSHYKILEKLGSGGMGEVYVAEDTKLSRKVALKIIRPETASHPERRMRFEREAKAVAALNHPHIVTIYSVEEAEGVHFITMELVRGKTLTELIPKKGLPLNKFLEIGIPLADAVSAAHEQGIIHRDLKPDNLMVSDEGRLKILDFGLAKLKQEFAEAGISELPTQSPTQEGRILGTVAYMSPEQAEGKTVDHRSDMFSIGIILYEMATGQRPFKGDTTASMLSSILRDAPRSVTDVNPVVPRDLGKIIRRCMVKDLERRYQTAKDLRNELEEVKQDVDSGEVLEGAGQVIVAPTTGGKKLLFAVVAAVLAAVSVTYILVRPAPEAEETPSAPIASASTRLTSTFGLENFPSLSPGGEIFIYSRWAPGNSDIYRQRVGGETAFNLTEDSAAHEYSPAFSPDGKQIVFRSEREGGGIFIMGATGESVKRLTDFGYNPAWSPDGKEIVFATDAVWGDPGARGDLNSQLWILNIASGEKRHIAVADAVQPSWSPHGHRIAFWAAALKDPTRDIWTLPANGGESVRVTDDIHMDWNPTWSPDGKYLYFSSDRGGSMNLWRVPIEEESGKALGPPEAVTTGGAARRGHLSFSKDGRRIAYVEDVSSSNIWKVALDPVTATITGEPIQITRTSRGESSPVPSPDGKWLAYYLSREQEDIFVMRTDGSGLRQLTDDAYYDRVPEWSPDGKNIAFYSNRSGNYEIWSINPDGSELKQLTFTAEDAIYPAWSPDGSQMAYYNGIDGLFYIFNLTEPWDEQTPIPLPPLEDGQQRFSDEPAWSPDGRWLAGNTSVGIVIYSLESQQYRSLSDFGGEPVWLADSRRLLFSNWGEGTISLVDLNSGEIHDVLSLLPYQVYSPAVSRDNRWLYFVRGASEADIWLLTLN